MAGQMQYPFLPPPPP
jgi:hypothetical protein